MRGNDTAIRQMVYGSTPYSAGYSILGMSPGIEEPLREDLIRSCESYDQQLHAAPYNPYSIAVYRLPGEFYVFMEIFGGWKDQMGRTSRVLRNAIIERKGWELLAGNPFLLLWLLPPVKKCISRKRTEVEVIPVSDLSHLSGETWQKLWWKETRVCRKILAGLSGEEKKRLLYFQSLERPFETLEIPVGKDQFLFCRVLAYIIPHTRRLDLQCESFALHQKPPLGICFRYSPYSQSLNPLNPSALDTSVVKTLRWRIATVIQSVPPPYNFGIVARWTRNGQIILTIAFVLFYLILLIVGLRIGW